MRIPIVLIAALAMLPSFAVAQTVQSGQWEIVTTIKDAVIPGAPPATVAAMKRQPNRVTRCLTAAEANRGPEDIMKQNKQCRFTRYSKKAGKMDSQMVCKQPDGTMTATSTGRFTATSFSTTAHVVRTGAQSVTMTTLAEGKRVGACGR